MIPILIPSPALPPAAVQAFTALIKDTLVEFSR
jgi:hypothetical protein